MFRTSKIWLSTSLILAMAVLLFTVHETAWAQSTFKLRYFTGMTPSHYFCSDLMTYFASEVEKRTDGRVKVELYPGGQLFGYQDGIDAATMGAVEMGLTSAGQWGGHNPIFKFSDYFLLIEDMDHWFRARDKVHPILDDLYQKKNVKLLYYSAYGANGICSLSPIENLQAIKGLKVRAPVPGAFDCLEAWGAVSAKVAAAEVYDALGKRAIDAAVSSWGVMYSRKFYEVAKHFVGPLWWTVWVNFIDLGTWNKLPEDIKQIIMEVSKETEGQSLGIMKNDDQKSIDELKKVGSMKLLTEEDKKEWVKPLQPVFEAWVKECAKAGFGEQAQQILDALNQAR
jgi:TRAP-type C4-dicarboxylate transport system substrate-binding protein